MGLGMEQCRSYFIALVFFATSALQSQNVAPRVSANRSDANVTAVTGESLLTHLGRSFGDTSMGKTGRLGAAPVAGADPQHSYSPVSLHSTNETVILRGSDLYRLNCQGCHGESGNGAPPEINSIISPVRGTSIALVRERMKNAGADISYADAAKLAQESKTALLERLHKGGKTMPAFPQLKETDIGPLLSYLKQLADMPGAQNEQSAAKESHLRVGEFIAKSTCHICHSAVGADPGPQELLEGAIPPLSTLTTRKNQSEFIRKVTQGAPVVMGTPAMLYRGRMPVFYYLNEEEVADVYLYLTTYPPSESVTPTPVPATSQDEQRPLDKGQIPPKAPALPQSMAKRRAAPSLSADAPSSRLLWLVPIAALLLAGGLVFTIREFKRLVVESARGETNACKLPLSPAVERLLQVLRGVSRPPTHGTAKGNSR